MSTKVTHSDIAMKNSSSRSKHQQNHPHHHINSSKTSREHRSSSSATSWTIPVNDRSSDKQRDKMTDRHTHKIISTTPEKPTAVTYVSLNTKKQSTSSNNNNGSTQQQQRQLEYNEGIKDFTQNVMKCAPNEDMKMVRRKTVGQTLPASSAAITAEGVCMRLMRRTRLVFLRFAPLMSVLAIFAFYDHLDQIEQLTSSCFRQLTAFISTAEQTKQPPSFFESTSLFMRQLLSLLPGICLRN